MGAEGCRDDEDEDDEPASAGPGRPHGCPAACLPVQLEATLLINQMDCETCTCVTEYMVVVLSSGSQCEPSDWNWS